MRSFLLLTAAALAAPVSAQGPCHAENDGGGFNDNVSMGGALVGVRFVAPAGLSAARIEVFTGEKTGTSALALWSHDAAANQPAASLSSGSFTMALPNDWQGADLAAAVPLAAGNTYWVVWTPIGSCQASVDVPMATPGQVYRGSFDNGQTWTGPFQFNDRHWKLRLYCPAAATPYCFGDGTLATTCPCGNAGATGRGCENSAATGGARLAASGGTSPDTLVLAGSGLLASAPTIFVQGDADVATGVIYGDGLRCAGGVLKVLYVKFASGGAASAPGAGEPAVSAQSAVLGAPIPPGATRYYQAVYRDPDPGFCNLPMGNTWNASNSLRVVW